MTPEQETYMDRLRLLLEEKRWGYNQEDNNDNIHIEESRNG